MAGVKGRSGGPRKNAGGKRAGAGRKPKAKARPARPEPSLEEEAAIGASLPPGPSYVAPPPVEPPAPPPTTTDTKLFLEGVVAGSQYSMEDRLNAAKALLPFQHRKLGEMGKKEQKSEDAGKVSRFAPARRPLLQVVRPQVSRSAETAERLRSTAARCAETRMERFQ